MHHRHGISPPHRVQRYKENMKRRSLIKGFYEKRVWQEVNGCDKVAVCILFAIEFVFA
jgi:hypothetical protein